MERTMAVHKLNPSMGPDKWRKGVVARFQFYAQPDRNEANRISDREERAYTLDLLNCGNSWRRRAESRREFSR